MGAHAKSLFPKHASRSSVTTLLLLFFHVGSSIKKKKKKNNNKHNTLTPTSPTRPQDQGTVALEGSSTVVSRAPRGEGRDNSMLELALGDGQGAGDSL